MRLQLSRLGGALKRLVHPSQPDKTENFYAGKAFIDGYVDHTNWRVAQDPKEAIGGMWEEIGALQLDFLRREGLTPQDRLLDLGCGTLRGGRHFIGYLDAGKYTGIDISPACIDAARALVRDEGLEAKNPALILNKSRKLEFAEFAGASFDYILAQSVLTHLPAEIIAECFDHVGRVMHPASKFYFTYWSAEEPSQIGVKDFAYPWRFFEGLAAVSGFEAQELSASYPHPRGQKMGMVRKASASRGAAPH